MKNHPYLIDGGNAIDDRGCLSFVNNISDLHIKRFYIVENHQEKFVRAWHAHKQECKFVYVVSGEAKIAAVKVDNWENPSKDLEILSFVLSEKKPNLLYIPSGFANGSMSLVKNTKIMYFSTSLLSDSQNDDFRFNANHWDCWDIEER
tara:strand:+ start:448 stop:891 length:444 start_codon:yes stop_codon:yes gene_type:complete